jgi:hypothetical protein
MTESYSEEVIRKYVEAGRQQKPDLTYEEVINNIERYEQNLGDFEDYLAQWGEASSNASSYVDYSRAEPIPPRYETIDEAALNNEAIGEALRGNETEATTVVLTDISQQPSQTELKQESKRQFAEMSKNTIQSIEEIVNNLFKMKKDVITQKEKEYIEEALNKTVQEIELLRSGMMQRGALLDNFRIFIERTSQTLNEHSMNGNYLSSNINELLQRVVNLEAEKLQTSKEIIEITGESKRAKEKFDELQKEREKMNKSIIKNEKNIKSNESKIEQVRTEFESVINTASSNNSKIIKLEEETAENITKQEQIYEMQQKAMEEFIKINDRMSKFNEANNGIKNSIENFDNYFKGISSKITELQELNIVNNSNDKTMFINLERVQSKIDDITSTFNQHKEQTIRNGNLLWKLIDMQKANAEQIGNLCGNMNQLSEAFKNKGQNVSPQPSIEVIDYGKIRTDLLEGIKQIISEPELNFRRYGNEKVIRTITEEGRVHSVEIVNITKAIEGIPDAVGKVNKKMLDFMKRQINSYNKVLLENTEINRNALKRVNDFINEQRKTNISESLLNNNRILFSGNAFEQVPQFKVFSNRNLMEMKLPSREEILGFIGVRSLSKTEEANRKKGGLKRTYALMPSSDPDPFVDPTFHPKKAKIVRAKRATKLRARSGAKTFSLRKLASLF